MHITVGKAHRHDWDDDWRVEVTVPSAPDAAVVVHGSDKATTVGRAITLADLLDACVAPIKEAPVDKPSLNLATRVAVDPPAIRRLIEDAVKQRWTLNIDYCDGEGRQTSRRILPASNGILKPVYGEEMIAARDLDKSEPRTFRLDRIQRAELVE